MPFGSRRRPARNHGVHGALSRTAGVLAARFLVLAAVAIGALALAATAGSLAARPVLANLSTDPTQGASPSPTTAPARGGSPTPAEPEIVTWVQVPTSLLPGGSRQIRVHVLEGPGAAALDVTEGLQVLTVTLEVHQPPSAQGTVSVAPSSLTVDRAALRSTRIDLALADDVACAAELGELRVRVRDAARPGAAVDVVVELPPVDCREPPPQVG